MKTLIVCSLVLGSLAWGQSALAYGGAWRSSAASRGGGSWPGFTTCANRCGQMHPAGIQGSVASGDGWHRGSGSYDSSWGRSGSWSGSGHVCPRYGGHHYGSVAYGGSYGAGLHVGYAAPAAPATAVTAPAVVVPPAVVAPSPPVAVPAPVLVPARVVAAPPIAAVRLRPFVRPGFHRRW